MNATILLLRRPCFFSYALITSKRRCRLHMRSGGAIVACFSACHRLYQHPLGSFEWVARLSLTLLVRSGPRRGQIFFSISVRFWPLAACHNKRFWSIVIRHTKDCAVQVEFSWVVKSVHMTIVPHLFFGAANWVE